MDKMREKLYEARWYSKEIEKVATDPKVKKLAMEQTSVLTQALGGSVIEGIKKEEPKIEVPQGQMGARLDWYPKAIRHVREMKTKGKYAKGWPLGAVVHFTAGRDGAAKTIDGGIKNGYCFTCIQKDGTMVQAHPISRWGYHAGESAWKTLTGAVSDDLIGIEINNAGRVTSVTNGTFKTWFGTYLKADEVRFTPGRENQLKGWYEKYTPAQEKTLIEFLIWLKRQAPEVFSFDHCLGHDEVAGPLGIGRWRKNDPGAALSMTMNELRALLKKKYAEG